MILLMKFMDGANRVVTIWMHFVDKKKVHNKYEMKRFFNKYGGSTFPYFGAAYIMDKSICIPVLYAYIC